MTDPNLPEQEGDMTLPNNILDITSLSVQIPEHVLFQQLDGEAVILDAKTGGYFGLNGVGSLVWQLLADGKTITEAVGAICERYEVGVDRATADVRGFLTALQDQALIVLHE